jgi:DNA-binding transcriptional regulator YhcF (GntR family)
VDAIIDEALQKIGIIGDSAFVIFCHLYRLSDEEGIVMISQRDLAAVTKKSLATVNQAMRVLRAAEFLDIDNTHGTGVIKIRTACTKHHNFITPPTTTLIKSESINKSSRRSKIHNTPEDDTKQKGVVGLTDLQALDMYMTVTGFPYVPPDKRDEIVGAIRAIHYSRNGDTEEYLRPFWAEAVKRYGKNTRLFWLSEWATSGEISKGKKKPKDEVFEEH